MPCRVNVRLQLGDVEHEVTLKAVVVVVAPDVATWIEKGKLSGKKKYL
jgi:hypothetical protein